MKFFKDFNIRKYLHNRNFAIAISLIAAFIFWVVIVVDKNPEREQVFNNLPIDISTDGTIWGEQGLEVVSDITQTATVTVYGPNYIVSSLKSSDIKINVDLSTVNGAGTHTVNLSAVRNSETSGYSFVGITPSAITVKFDYFDEKSFAVEPIVEGYGRVDGLIYDDEVVANAENALISIKGPRTEVSKISKVIAYAESNKELSSTTVFDGDIRLLDEQGDELDRANYTLSADSVKISVPVSKTKVMTFKPSYTNMWNSGIEGELSGRWSADISTFTVAGPPDIIDALSTVEFTPIDVTKLSPKNNNTFELKPILPNGVRITDGIETITVSYNLSGFESKRIRITKIEDEDTLPSGLVASFSKDVYVEVCGAKDVISKLTSADCYLAVNLSNVAQGDSLVNATVKTYSKAPVWQVVSCEITVKIK